jgi:octaprenyl-diphosphate synthase
MIEPDTASHMIEAASYLEEALPRINAYLEQQTELLDPLVRPVAAHVLSAGGKRLRPLLTILTARGLGHEMDDLLPLACSMELLHSATLLHDDILDGADLRRGRPASHIVFGKTETILAGDVLLALANKLVAEYGVPGLTVVLAEAVMRTASGEVREIAATRKASLSLDEYMDIITGKTAFLFQGACRCGAIIADADKQTADAVARFGLHLGIAFQLSDDALDYTSPESVSGKPVGGDLREGKITMPLIHYMNNLTPDEQEIIAPALENGSLDEESVEKILTAVESEGYAEMTRKKSMEYTESAKHALSTFPNGLEKDILLQIAEYVPSRHK